MSTRESESKATESENGLEVVDREENGDYIVKHQQTGNTLTIVNTFAEMFPIVETSPANSTTPLFLNTQKYCVKTVDTL